jgi:hypothetical protein
MEAMRWLKRRISDSIYHQLVVDAQRAAETSPRGHYGATLQPSAVDLPPHIDTSDQPLPGPATGAPPPAKPHAASAPQPPRRHAEAVQVERPHRTTDLNRDKGRRTLQGAETALLTTERSRNERTFCEGPRDARNSKAAKEVGGPSAPTCPRRRAVSSRA